MPGPTTEILNEDIKVLKGDLRDVRSNVEVLKGDVKRVEIGLAEVRTEFRLAKWLIGLLLVTALTGVASGIWWASKLDTKVNALELRFDRQEDLMAKILEQMRSVPAPQSQPK